MLKMTNVKIEYDKNVAVENLSLSAKSGSIITLIGPNGAGKSSTLKAIVGIKKIKSGSIEYYGKELHKMKPADIVKEGIILVPEGRRLFPEMTVHENLLIGAFIRKKKYKIKKDLEKIYHFFPILAERNNQIAATLSGGQQQMVAIARGLMAKPRHLLLDEPSLGLAPLIVKDIAKIIKLINSEGVSIILVEQNARMALKLAEYGYVLELGKVAFEGSADKLIKNSYVTDTYLGKL